LITTFIKPGGLEDPDWIILHPQATGAHADMDQILAVIQSLRLSKGSECDCAEKEEEQNPESQSQ
jgi:hypothetical protein